MTHPRGTCVPCCGDSACIHIDKVWNRRDPWGRSRAEIFAQANDPTFKALVDVGLVLLALLAIYGVFH
jgi:hypothetical protein